MTEKKKPVQRMRYTDQELSLIKNTFADNEDIIMAIRKHFLQMPKDAIDQQVLDGIKQKPELLALLRKAFLPELDPKAPIHQLVDLWMTIDMKDKSPEQAYPQFISRKTLIEYLDQQFSLLEGSITDIKIELVKLATIDDKDEVTMFADLLARNNLISHTEMQLSQFIVLAGSNTETVEQTKERLMKNSSK